jgi:hypothetical protein
VAVTEYVPAARIPKVQPTVVDVTVDCTQVVPPVTVNVTDPPVSPAVVVNDGVVSVVIPSELLDPLSLAVSRLGADGAVGAVVSITIELLFPSDPDAPGAANVRVASLPAASRTVAPFGSRADVPV